MYRQLYHSEVQHSIYSVQLCDSCGSQDKQRLRRFTTLPKPAIGKLFKEGAKGKEKKTLGGPI